MENDKRLDPDILLRAIKSEEKIGSTASLRVFLGMSAGVGKTYAMLKMAHQKKLEGVDVVIGIVETHGRSETSALLHGLEILPRIKIKYRDTELEEMDIDAILKRRPKLVIVDELAHSNVPGSRHEKRYQDVLEILDAGINVYTALNVQHLESRKDIIESISGISIRETVPDSMLERADLVELVDIAPSELLKRLSEGKVYLGDKVTQASQNFFKEDRLTALREIALRMTAERVEHDLQRLSAAKVDKPWQTNERILVAISHSPYSEKLIRATRRLAYNLEAPWIAVHIDTGIQLSDVDQAQLVKNLNLARELRAEVITTTDTDVPSALERISRQRNVTQIIVGRPARRFLKDFFTKGSLLDRLVLESRDVDVHVLRQDETINYRPPLLQGLIKGSERTSFIKYWNTFWFMVGLSLLSGALVNFLGYRSISFVFLIGVLIVGLFGSLGAVLFSAALGAFMWNFFFIPPVMTFVIRETDDIFLCLSYFVVASFTGYLSNRLKFHERLIREREERTNLLYQIMQDLSSTAGPFQSIGLVKERVDKLLSAQCHIYMKTAEGSLDFSLKETYFKAIDEKEKAVALWCLQNQKAAGWSTDTLGQAASLYIPIKGTDETIGVFSFNPKNRNRKLGLDQETLLYSIVRIIGGALERNLMSAKIIAAQRLEDSSLLHQTLLNSISHEMRTPLTSIMGSVYALENQSSSDPNIKLIARNLSEASERLNHVIENLLDMSRLSSGVLSLRKEWHDLHDLIYTAVNKVKKSHPDRKISIVIDPTVQLLQIDFKLFEHLLTNLLLNSFMYSDVQSTVSIKCFSDNKKTSIVIEDEGSGIDPKDAPFIFEKFFRAKASLPGGVGLGLAIVKGIVELHRGTIYYEDNKPKGARFVIELPLEKQPTVPQEKEN